eukprot:jgi/Chrzof1/13708/Cz08g09020.t1
MYDFCFTFPYAFLLALGGAIGFALKGSTTSLGAGLGSAAVLSLLGYWSLQEYHKGRSCKASTVLSLGISATLSYVMYQRYASSGKIMPAGFTAMISAAMSAFYLWSVFLGPKPKPKNKPVKAM